MYLKNDSIFQCGLQTKTGILTINPGEVVFVLDNDVEHLNSKLTIATEEDYFKFTRNNKDDEKTKKEAEEKAKAEAKLAEEKAALKEAEEKAKLAAKLKAEEDAKLAIEKETKKDEPKKDEPKTSELDTLEKKLEDLKTKWQNTTRASKKAAIQKEIKEVQDQIAKLK